MNETDIIVNELNDLLQELQGDIDFAVESVEHASRQGCFELSNDIINDLVSMVSVMIDVNRKVDSLTEYACQQLGLATSYVENEKLLASEKGG
jgi:hypothetical protein